MRARAGDRRRSRLGTEPSPFSCIHADLDAVGRPIGRRDRQPNAKLRRALVRESDHALGAAAESDGVLKSAFASGIEGRVDTVGDPADVGEQVTAVDDGRGAELSREHLVSRADCSDDLEPLPDRQLSGDGPHRPARAQDQQSLARCHPKLA